MMWGKERNARRVDETHKNVRIFKRGGKLKRMERAEESKNLFLKALITYFGNKTFEYKNE